MTTIRDCHITGNTANSTGAGLRNNSPLTLIGSTISNNAGNGIAGYAALSMINSTVTGNASSGLYHFAGVSSITNSTITNNQPGSGNEASGITRPGGILTLRSTIVAGNVNAATVGAIGGSAPTSNSKYLSGGYNLIGYPGSSQGVFNQRGDQISGLDPKLDPLGYYRRDYANASLKSRQPRA